MSIPVVFDFEGPLGNPALDFAWVMYDKTSASTKERFPKRRIEEFDRYDDALWEIHRDKRGHSTGTTPLIIDCIAAIDGMTNRDLVSLTEEKMQLNPGVTELLAYLTSEVPVYIVTSSHPALSLSAADELGVTPDRIRTHGYQHGRCDSVELRSPISGIAANCQEVSDFLDKYLDACALVLTAIDAKDELALQNAIMKRNRIVTDVDSKELAQLLHYIFISERCVMGGHNKARVLQRIAPDGNVIYIGDSIVDADAIKFARYGFSVNCTNHHALRDSKFNIVTRDMFSLLPLLDDVQSGGFDTRGTSYSGMAVFTPQQVTYDFDAVKTANAEAKNFLKGVYNK